MLHTPGDDPISFIGRDLLQSLDGINGGSSPSRTPNLQQHPSQQQHPHQFAQPHPQYHPHQYQRGIILREDGPVFEDEQHPHEFEYERSGAYGRSTSDEHPSSISHGVNGDHVRGFSNGPGGGNGGYYGPMEASGGQQNPYQPQPQYSLPPRHSSPPPSSNNHYPQAGSSSNPNLLPFPPDSDTNLYPPPSPYFPPEQHRRPADPLYSAQGSSHPSSLNQQQQFPSSRQQQQQPSPQHLQQQQQQLPPQTLIPVTMANSLGLPVGMGGVNPLLGAGGRFPGGFGRLNGARGLEGLQQGAGGGRSEIEEEISTIFVVGFPDDMQEREFQNMFTFCRDFEAATLKLPPPVTSAGGLSSTTGLPLPSPNPLSPPSNAELNSYYYGPQAHFLDPSAPFDLYHDPTNPTSNPALAAFGLGGLGAGAAGLPGGRRQIIGFAKFRTRQAALEARDALQGRKVDVDRASVLKAEMAKKNLHTRRGVGGDEPLAGGGGGGAGGGIGQIIGGLSLSLAAAPIPGTSALSRGRLDAFGPGGGGGAFPGGDWSNSPRAGGSASTQQQPFASTSTQPHSRAQSYPYPSQAFESNQAQPSSRPSSSLSSSSDPSSPRYAPSSSQTETPLPPSQHQFESRLQSQQRHFPLSPPNHHSYPQSLDPSSRFAREDDILLLSPPPSAALSSSYPQQQQQQQQPAPRTRSLSRPQQAQPSRRGFESGLPDASEAAEVFSEGDNEMGEGRPGGGFDGSSTGPIGVGAGRGAGTGEDTGPGSASSSLGRAGGEKVTRSLPRTSNPADMNPPINTLYVGNLPTSPPPTHPSTHLEDALRALFSRCEGFRRMSFRQKSNGPMCFVEFEDVTTASSALRDLYGESLNGLVKGGIRLSYSKHPLGQRGPPTTTSSTTSSSTISGVPTAPTTIPGSSLQIHGASSSTTSSSGGGGPSSFSSPPHPVIGSPIEATFHSDSSATSSHQPQHHHHHHQHHQHHASLSPPTSFAAGLPLPSRSSAVPPRSTGASAFERHSSPPNPEYLSSSSSHSHFGSSPSSSAMLTQSPASTRGFLSTSVHQDWKGGMGTFSPFGGEVESG